MNLSLQSQVVIAYLAALGKKPGALELAGVPGHGRLQTAHRRRSASHARATTAPATTTPRAISSVTTAPFSGGPRWPGSSSPARPS
jgi:hypothetical protein